MSVISILTKQSPKIAGYQFDAVLEDSFEASVELTSYPVESGVRINDHRIINPMTYYLTGAVGNNPLKVLSVDFAGGIVSNVVNNPVVSAIAGLSAGFLAGSDSTRSSATLQKLLEIMFYGDPFTVDAVDIQLQNMVITKVSRTRNPENENGLIFVAELHELVTLNRLASKTQPSQSQLNANDPTSSAAAATVNSGEQVGTTPTFAVTEKVNSVINLETTPI